MMNENNIVELTGEIVEGLTFSHEVYGKKFYETKIKADRLSGTADIIPAILSEKLIGADYDLLYAVVSIKGQLRSHNRHDGIKNRLTIAVFVTDFEILSNVSYSDNAISLDGYICKPAIYRMTPTGREIADIMLAVNRAYGKSDYIPCVAWGRNARDAAGLGVGTRIQVQGRIQSRNYVKVLSDTEIEERIAYEVSISKVKLVDIEQHEGCDELT